MKRNSLKSLLYFVFSLIFAILFALLLELKFYTASGTDSTLLIWTVYLSLIVAYLNKSSFRVQFFITLIYTLSASVVVSHTSSNLEFLGFFKILLFVFINLFSLLLLVRTFFQYEHQIYARVFIVSFIMAFVFSSSFYLIYKINGLMFPLETFFSKLQSGFLYFLIGSGSLSVSQLIIEKLIFKKGKTTGGSDE